MIKSISDIVALNSSIIFDYPTNDDLEIKALANGTNEEMTNTYFELYNTFNPNNKMKAPNNVNYCLAVKK